MYPMHHLVFAACILHKYMVFCRNRP